MTRRPGLFLKYAVPLVILVSGALVVSGLVEIFFSYRENKEALSRLQHEKAVSAAIRIEQFVRELERQLAWIAQTPWGPRGVPLDQRRLDSLRLLRHVPAVTEVSHLDPTGHEQLRVSRLAMDVAGSNQDFSADPKFREAHERKPYFSAVYFRKESEPYMTIALAGMGEDTGVVAAEANLKFIWDVVSGMKMGDKGVAYVVDSAGRLIAHPDISLVLQKTDLAALPQVRAAAAARSAPDATTVDALIGRNLQGREVLSGYATIAPLGWTVFVDLPLREALAPLYESVLRTVVLLVVGVTISVVASLWLVRRMVAPVQILQSGAAKIGAGAWEHRIDIKTGDELQTLAEEFNRMTARLQESYAGLERKVENRTRDLSEALERLKALSSVGQAVNSTLDMEQVLATIVAQAVQLAAADSGAVFDFDETTGEFAARTTLGIADQFREAVQAARPKLGEGAMGLAAVRREPVQIADVEVEAAYDGGLRGLLQVTQMRALLALPLLREGRILGGLLVSRQTPGAFAPEVVDLLQTFAAQSTLAIQNARLFREIEQKGRELETASQHKSQFLANMSHELRTPLNAILGYTELVADGIYGEVPAKIHEVVERVQKSGRHLLGLINDVLDISKIEAGQLKLAIVDYSISDVVQSVTTAVESLAAEKQLALSVDVPANLPVAAGDERRITQVLLNLVGNAIKFTEAGGVQISVRAADGEFLTAVRDTGPGIDAEHQQRIFEEFQQVDSSPTKTKGGTGLGLAIARRIVEMHGGRIWVESTLGEGSTFRFSVPVRAVQTGDKP